MVVKVAMIAGSTSWQSQTALPSRTGADHDGIPQLAYWPQRKVYAEVSRSRWARWPKLSETAQSRRALARRTDRSRVLIAPLPSAWVVTMPADKASSPGGGPCPVRWHPGSAAMECAALRGSDAGARGGGGIVIGRIAAIFCISSVLSSVRTSIASSMVMIPTNMPSLSRTGMAVKSCAASHGRMLLIVGHFHSDHVIIHDFVDGSMRL